jgi:hypothetical protein
MTKHSKEEVTTWTAHGMAKKEKKSEYTIDNGKQTKYS